MTPRDGVPTLLQLLETVAAGRLWCDNDACASLGDCIQDCETAKLEAALRAAAARLRSEMERAQEISDPSKARAVPTTHGLIMAVPAEPLATLVRLNGGPLVDIQTGGREGGK